MNANAKLRLFIVVCALFVTRSEVRSTKTLLPSSRLNIEEGDAGSGSVRKVIETNIPDDDTESSGEPENGGTDNECGSGDGSGESGSGGCGGGYPKKTNGTATPVTTHQTVELINVGDGAKTTIAGETTKKIVVVQPVDNRVDPDSNPNNINLTGGDNAIPDTAQSTGSDYVDDSTLANSGVNFTVAIIVGVVVGAILSILIIVFLVYRLRKKDEGSYSLDEQSSAMLRNDTDSPPPKGKGEEYGNYA